MSRYELMCKILRARFLNIAESAEVGSERALIASDLNRKIELTDSRDENSSLQTILK